MAEYEAGLWEVDYSQAGPDAFEGDDLEQLQADCENVAVNILWNFTNRMFGTREVVLRPVKQLKVGKASTFEGRGPYTSYPQGSGRFWQPVLLEGLWYNLMCGQCVGGCSCISPWTIQLPGQPIEVTKVTIDETDLAPSEYWLDGAKLIRSEGNWPTEQNMRKQAGQVGTWSIEYTAGIPVPKGGEIAAGILAAELGRAALDDSACALPERVQTITRQGVTMAILDTFDDLAKGRVGLPRVDMWIASVNVKRSAARIAVSPDVR